MVLDQLYQFDRGLYSLVVLQKVVSRFVDYQMFFEASHYQDLVIVDDVVNLSAIVEVEGFEKVLLK